MEAARHRCLERLSRERDRVRGRTGSESWASVAGGRLEQPDPPRSLRGSSVQIGVSENQEETQDE